MNQAIYLDKNKSLDPALDVNELRKKGIEIIQQLTGSFWTDYNLHDPGVTILEQLCYALSELSFRTDYDIEQLLFREGEKDLPFFRPEEILTSNPLSTDDLRKLFLDTIAEIKNIWFEPVSEYDSGFNGLYRVLVDLALISPGEEEIASIKEKIYRLFSSSRNLCEDIFEIKILEQMPVKICGDIETDGLNELSRIMANIYFKVEQTVNPEVKFYSLEELKEKGKDYDEIFDGPVLKHGFVLSEELISQPGTIVVSDLVKMIMQVEGVVSVKNLHLEVEGEKYYNQLAIPGGFMPRFIHDDMIGRDGEYTIHFYKGNLKYNGFDAADFRKHLNELVSENKKAFRINESSFELPEVQQGIDFEKYYSIQNHFPAIYGLGEEGLMNRPDAKRKAQANQLKGYLMIFEQLMANYFSQLAHFKDLLSIHKRLNNTYFCQSLDQVPHADRFYADKNSPLQDAYFDFGRIPQNYRAGLQKLNDHFDDFVDRKNRMLDFLLAMHGESYTRYSLSQFNYYYSAGEFKKLQIKSKSALLQQLANINYNRAAGINYYDRDKSEITGIEKKLHIILGLGLDENEEGKISIGKKKSLFEIVNRYQLKLIPEGSKSAAFKKWEEASTIENIGHTQDSIEDSFDYIDDEDLKGLEGLSEEERKDLLGKLIPFATKALPAGILVSGVNLMNYMAGKIKGERKGFALIYRSSDGEAWQLVGEFETEKQLQLGVQLLIDVLIELNKESEGFHLVEHVLMRPGPNESKYGIYMNDEQGHHLLKSEKQYSLEERDHILEKVRGAMSEYDNYSVVADENRDMKIVFTIPKEDIRFVSIRPDISVEKTHSDMEQLYRYMSDKDSQHAFEDKTGFYVQYEQDEDDIPEYYYTYKFSLVFPSWTARFSNQEFRSIVQDLIWEQKPAAVYADIHWLTPGDMARFEKLYNNWTLRGDLHDADKDYSEKNGSADLARFLYAKSKK